MQCVKCSRFYVTEPEGFSSPNLFVNAAAKFRTTLSPEKVLELTQNVEKAMGRKFKNVGHEYCDRPIDIDILFYGCEILQTARLAVPHPLLTQRLFVLEPLAEIAPCLVHPQEHKTILHLLQDLKRSRSAGVSEKSK